jgi:hypothetical protein
MANVPIVTSRPIDFSSRINEFKVKQDKLKDLFKIKDDIEISTGNFHSGIQADRYNKMISIPLSFLLKVEDIPPAFRISGLNDPRFDDENFLGQVARWLNVKIKEAGLDSKCNPITVLDVQKMFMLMNEPEQFEKSKDFVFAHEVAHFTQNSLTNYLIIIGASIAATIIIFACPIPLSIATAAYAAFSVAQLVGIVMLRKFYEKDADLKAAEALQDTSGGIYFNNFRLECNKRMMEQKECPEWIKWLHDAQGNFRVDILHPSLSERIKYLKEWSPQQNQGLFATHVHAH